jgi:predicted alpha/beta-hydrolase family hydrolase
VATFEFDTPHGLARAHVHPAAEPRAALVLGHGAGGGVASADLVAVTDVARAEGVSVALVEQPYRVAGRRSPTPARQLDAAWSAAIDYLLAGELHRLPLLVGGRSLGARVACRTAEVTDALAVLCLAFPLRAPGRASAASRLDELDAVTVPVLVVQGERDPFGMPPMAEHRTVVQVPGDHSLKTDLEAVANAVRSWLPSVLAQTVRPPASLQH